MQKQSKLYSIFNGAIILTLAGLFTKILSATYRIPYHHIAGDIGFYIYQQVYPLYGIALQLGTYGFPVIISKLVADYAATNRRKKIRGILQVSFAFLFVVGCTIFAFEYIFAENNRRMDGRSGVNDSHSNYFIFLFIYSVYCCYSWLLSRII
ncbi:oligosaccharide flippase family protein [Priestia aryabhattai]